MKISIVEPHLLLYGGIRRMIEFANRLSERGHEVTIFHPEGTPCQWTRCIAKIKPSVKLLDEPHETIIYNDPNPYDYNLVKRAKAQLKVFYVLELYDKGWLKGPNPIIYIPKYKRMLMLKKSLFSPYLKLANATWIHHWLKDNLNIDTRLLIAGVNTDVFHPVEIKKEPEKIKILHSGDPRLRKGTKNILDAFEIVKKELPQAELDTYYGKKIPQNRMAEMYSSADIFVDGQWYAGWNNPVAEAMACNVPVVCTDIGGVKDFAFHEKTALLVPVRSPKALAETIIRLIKDERLRVSLRENAYKQIIAFKWENSVSELERILADELTCATFNPSYIGPRPDISAIIPQKAKKILDVGCGTGALGRNIKKQKNAEVTGIEANEKMAREAEKVLDKVIISDAEAINLNAFLQDNYFDCIVLSDILEHLKDPWRLLDKLKNFLKQDGVFVASIPNAQHYSTINSLFFKGYWPYRERGIHDKTHLRFFTLKNIEEMLAECGLEITKLKRNYRIIEKPHPLNAFTKLFAWLPLKNFLTFQYLFVAGIKKE
jgi:methionine biosynthesis protein MetW